MHRGPLSLFHCLLGLLYGLTTDAVGQGSVTTEGNLTVLRTGGAVPLVTASQPLFVDPSLNSPALQFDFGFSTSEIDFPQNFLDAITVTLQSVQNLTAAIYATMDASGVSWAPPSPGTLVLNPDTIERQPIPFPSLAPDLQNKLAYSVRVPVPAELLGQSLTLYFDLFDNQDANMSLAWSGQVSVVPEPPALALAVVGGFVLLLVRRARR